MFMMQVPQHWLLIALKPKVTMTRATHMPKTVSRTITPTPITPTMT